MEGNSFITSPSLSIFCLICFGSLWPNLNGSVVVVARGGLNAYISLMHLKNLVLNFFFFFLLEGVDVRAANEPSCLQTTPCSAC